MTLAAAPYLSTLKATICRPGRSRFKTGLTASQGSPITRQLRNRAPKLTVRHIGVISTPLVFGDLTASTSQSPCIPSDITVQSFTRNGSEYPPRFSRDGGSAIRGDCGGSNRANEPTTRTVHYSKATQTALSSQETLYNVSASGLSQWQPLWK